MNGQVLSAVPQAHLGAETAEFGLTGRLPDELLGEIFAVLHLPDRLRAATVCRRWRSVSLDAAGQLRWTVIGPGPIITPQGLDACKGLLARSRGALTTFVIRDMYYGNFEQLADMAVEHLPHIKELDVTLWPHPFLYEDVPQKVASCISSMLQTDAPVLERLRVDNHARHAINDVSILQAPVLSALELRGVELSCLRKCAGSPTLRTLIVDTQATRWTWDSPWSLICSFPSLETLGVGFVNLDIPSDVSDERRPLPEPLKRLALSLRAETLTQLIDPAEFARLDAWHLEFLNAAFRHLAPLPDVLPYLQHIPPSAAAMVQFDGNAMHLTATAAGGRNATVHGLQADGDWGVPLAAARTLCVGGLGSLPRLVSQARAPFPALEELTLDVTPESTAYTSSTFKWPHLECPVLCAVSLRSAGAPRTIPLAAITSLLQDALDAGPGKLAALALHGVHVSAPEGIDAVVALNEMADTVTIVDAGSVWPECHLAWNRPWDEFVH